MVNSVRHAILIIGCGSIGERHLRCFQATRRAEVTACDADAARLERVSQQYGVPAVSDWESAFASGRYTLAVVCTPAPLHVPIGLDALRRGLHVLIEKPLSHSLSGVDDLLEAQRQSRAQAAVAYVLHTYPWLVAARAFLAGGGIGAVRQVTLVAGQPFHRHRPDYARSYYRDHAMGGGAIQDALTHSVNWVESVVGPTDSVLCDCAHLALPEVEVEDTVHVSTRHGPVHANFSLNQFQPPTESYLQFNSEEGSVRIESHLQRWGLRRPDDAEWTWHGTAVANRDAHFIAQAEAFLDQVEGRPARLCGLEAAAATLRFNLAALASARSGSRVHCRQLHA